MRRRLRSGIVAVCLALAAWAAPASAQEVRFRGTMSWESFLVDGQPFVPDRARLLGPFAQVELDFSATGTSAVYETYGFGGFTTSLQLVLERCAVPGCSSPGQYDQGESFWFYLPAVEVPFFGDLEVNGSPPEGYGVQSVSSSYAVEGGTISQGQVYMVTQLGDGVSQPTQAFHSSLSPLTVLDPTHASATTRMGFGRVWWHDVHVEYAECGPPALIHWAPLGSQVTATEPVVIPEATVVNAVDCTQGPLVLDLESSGSAARVGAVKTLTATLKNNSTSYLWYDPRLHWEIKGPARPRAFSTMNLSCSMTGYTAETDTATADCTIFELAPGQTMQAQLDISALEPGDIEVTLTATSFTADPVSVTKTFGAVAGTGADIQAYASPGYNYETGYQHWLNTVGFTVVNLGPERAEDVEVRFTSEGLPVNWWALQSAWMYFRDFGYVEGTDSGVSCLWDSSSADLVCRIAFLDPWQEINIAADWYSEVSGTVLLTMTTEYAGDTDLTNNSLSIPVTVAETPLADLSSTHVALTSNPSVNAPLTFAWTIHNAGPSATTAIAFWNAPGLLSYQVLSAPGFHDCFTWSTEVICTFHDFPPGASAHLQVVTQPPSGGEYLSSSHVITPYPDRYDPDFNNNATELVTDVSGRIPAISRTVTSLSGSIHIPCIPGQAFVMLQADGRGHDRLQTRMLRDGSVGGFYHSNVAYRSTAGAAYVTTDSFDFLTFELVRGQQRQSQRIHVGPKKSGEDLRYAERYTFVERRPDGTEGMTLSWRLTLRYQQDDQGRWFEVLDRSDFECRR